MKVDFVSNAKEIDLRYVVLDTPRPIDLHAVVDVLQWEARKFAFVLERCVVVLRKQHNVRTLLILGRREEQPVKVWIADIGQVFSEHLRNQIFVFMPWYNRLAY